MQIEAEMQTKLFPLSVNCSLVESHQYLAAQIDDKPGLSRNLNFSALAILIFVWINLLIYEPQVS